MSVDDDELEQLRVEQPAHPKCVNCRTGRCEECLYLSRPTSCSCGCAWLKEGRQPRGGNTMTETWYPPAVRDPQDDVGPFVAGAPDRGVLHTTESPHFPTYKPGTHPHFTVWLDSAGQVHVTQHVPVNHASAALVHASGQVDTNREGAIQIEIAWYAANITSAPRTLLEATRKLMRWIEAQTGIARKTVPFKPYPASYGAGNGVRMSVAEWKAFHGWCGHEHVPENDHGDPGAINMTFLLADEPKPIVHNPYPAPGVPFDCRPGRTPSAAHVEWLQWSLGFTTGHGLDGQLGEHTRDALLAFKKAHGLAPDLVVRQEAMRLLTAVHR